MPQKNSDQFDKNMKVTIDIEQFDNGISLKWNDSEGHDPEAIVALDRDKETAIWKMIWDDIKSAMDAALTNTVRMEIDYLVYFDEEKKK